MIRRKLTLKRVDPWTVLKFGFVVNLVLLLVGLLAFWILWVTIGRLGLVDQFCGSVGSIVLDLQECSLNGGNIFRTFLFLGILGVVVQTGILVFGAFLYNLIADLTGGLTFTFLDESGDAVASSPRRAESTARAATDSSTKGPAERPARPAGSAAGSSVSPRSAGEQAAQPSPPTPPATPTYEGLAGSQTASPGEAKRAPERTSNSSSGSLWNDPTKTRE